MKSTTKRRPQRRKSVFQLLSNKRENALLVVNVDLVKRMTETDVQDSAMIAPECQWFASTLLRIVVRKAVAVHSVTFVHPL
jgi:hypothetical protein